MSELQDTLYNLSFKSGDSSNNTWLASVKSSLDDMNNYDDIVALYLDSVYRQDPVCQESTLTCPDGMSVTIILIEDYKSLCL